MKEYTLQIIEVFVRNRENFIFYKEGVITHKLNDERIVSYLQRIIDYCDGVLSAIHDKDPSEPYLNQFSTDLGRVINYFTIPRENAQEIHFLNFKYTFDQFEESLELYYKNAIFNLELFQKIDFLKTNIVAIGANGSGKTSLTEKLKPVIGLNGVVISAQRLLLVPKFDSYSNPSSTAQNLKQIQLSDKSNKNINNFNNIEVEFRVVLENLLSQNIKANNDFKLKAKEDIATGRDISPPIETNLDKAINIWNSLIEHRSISCTDGTNLVVHTKDKSSYSLSYLSDGEKVVLYLVAQVLQAPSGGFIVVDEPEMYLHKTILNKLWDILEKERNDSIFIYFTHDLDFASSRITAKKIWIRSFSHPDRWDIEPIPQNELPESLMMELLGSRKNILFCEGERGSIDEKIYSLLYPEYSVIPVSTSTSVIDYTKAFNKLPNSTIKAFGIIDSDHHPVQKLESLRQKNVYSISLAEVENLFLDEFFLKLLATQLMVEFSKIDLIKTAIISQLESEMELQVSNYVSSKINYHFKQSHVSKGNSFNDVSTNYAKFTEDIKIEKWFGERKNELVGIIEQKQYDKALSVFNNKGLKTIVHTHFNISDFTERAIRLLQFNGDTQEVLLKHLPKELKASNASSSVKV